MIPHFPKIFHLGQIYIKNILSDPIEITEKLDGSAFSFGRVKGVVYCRSKSSVLYENSGNEMFDKATTYVRHIQERLPEGIIFHAEYLRKPKHNALKYDRIPTNNLSLFGVEHLSSRDFIKDYQELQSWADLIETDVVPLLYLGKLATTIPIKDFLDRESYLGGVKIEGVVVKNYYQQMNVGDVFFPIVCGKYVSEAFKEQLHKTRDDENKVGPWESYKLSYRTEARWNKAIQHLREAGLLEIGPRDIGPLIKEIQRDIIEECQEDIKEFLWKNFHQEILRVSTRGFPEYYKEKLLEGAFDA